MLSPEFFPLWDDKIARAYHCHYTFEPARKYISFCQGMKQLASELQPHVNLQETEKTLLKLIDEYNYAKHTKHWI